MKNFIKNRIILYLIIAFVLFIVVIGCITLKNNNTFSIQTEKDNAALEPFDPENMSYMFDGEKITLKNGIFETKTQFSTTPKIIIKYFGNKIMGDVDGDSVEDAIFILTKQTELNEFIYYLGVVLDKGLEGGVSLSPIILGDRVILQKLNFENGNIVLNYIDGNSDQPENTLSPTDYSLILRFDNSTKQLKYISENTDLNVDISKMSISMKAWKWVNTTYDNKKIILPKGDDSFLLNLNNDGSLFSTTDCNAISGSYLTERNSLIIKNIISTEKYCKDSKELEYKSMIRDAKEYRFTTKGELQIFIKKNNGIMTFK